MPTIHMTYDEYRANPHLAASHAAEGRDVVVTLADGRTMLLGACVDSTDARPCRTTHHAGCECHEAARDAALRLAEERAGRLAGALRPFAEAALAREPNRPDAVSAQTFTLGELWAARAALKEEDGDG